MMHRPLPTIKIDWKSNTVYVDWLPVRVTYTPPVVVVVKKAIMKIDKGPHPRSRLQFKPSLKTIFGFTTQNQPKCPYKV